MTELAAFTSINSDGERSIIWVDMDKVILAENARSYIGLDKFDDIIVLHMSGIDRAVPVLALEWAAACALYVTDTNDFTSIQ